MPCPRNVTVKNHTVQVNEFHFLRFLLFSVCSVCSVGHYLLFRAQSRKRPLHCWVISKSCTLRSGKTSTHIRERDLERSRPAPRLARPAHAHHPDRDQSAGQRQLDADVSVARVTFSQSANILSFPSVSGPSTLLPLLVSSLPVPSALRFPALEFTFACHRHSSSKLPGFLASCSISSEPPPHPVSHATSLSLPAPRYCQRDVWPFRGYRPAEHSVHRHR